ncbi:MAG TPA: PKD domain-containing protein, partial [Ferruginibacter sp.]|nr:PKD domain-containing protein [Ferruginibacter sp.]
MTALFAVKTRFLILAMTLLGFVSKAQLSADFTASPTSGCAPLVVNFTDQSTGSPNQWLWDLGNSTTSVNQNPSATYFSPGQYTVKLVVRNAAGNADSITKTQFITVYNQPTVLFTGTPLSGCYPLPVQFTDQSVAGSGSLNLWQWDFGDGATGAIQNPAHTYLTSGNFNVTLRVRNTLGCITVLTKNQYIQVNDKPHADFTNTNPTSCNAPATIIFTNASTGTGLTYNWNFGDGGTSTTTNPSHTYVTAGTYTVRLIVTNASGCKDTIIKSNLINVGSTHATFTSPDSVCINNTITFTNTSAPAPASVTWYFGDNTTSTVLSPVKQYSATGTYTVKLVANFGACSDSTTKTIIVKPKPTSAFTGSP